MAEEKETAVELKFEHEGKTYRPILENVFIPGLGNRTALEICADEKAQEYLVKEGCVGTIIEVVK